MAKRNLLNINKAGWYANLNNFNGGRVLMRQHSSYRGRIWLEVYPIGNPPDWVVESQSWIKLKENPDEERHA